MALNDIKGLRENSVGSYDEILLNNIFVPYTGAIAAVDLGANNFTVDTNTLKADATNHRVGIGSAGTGHGKLTIDTTGSAASIAPLYLIGSGNYGSGIHAKIGNYLRASQSSSGLHYMSWGMYHTGAAWVREYTSADKYLPYLEWSTGGTMAIGGTVSNLTTDTAPTLNPLITFDVTSRYVGILTASPTAPLDVTGIIQSKTGTNVGEYRIGGSSVMNSTATDGSLLRINTGGFTNVLINGNVGVKTATPLATFNVYGNTKIGLSTRTPYKTLDIAGHINFDQVPNPTSGQVTGMTLANGGAGNIPAGIYYYNVAFYTADGETGNTFSATIPTITLAGASQVNISNIPISTDPRVIGRKIFRSQAGTSGDYYYVYEIGTIANNTATTWTDNTAINTTSGNWMYNKANTTTGFFYIDQAKVSQLSSVVTGYGYGALFSLTRGSTCAAFGSTALYSCTSGDGNQAFGHSALYYVTTGSSNNAFGYASGQGNVTGSQNNSFGASALRNDTSQSYSFNVAIGTEALRSLLNNNNYNTAIGHNAGRLAAGTGNIFVGATAGSLSVQTATGSYNIVVGYGAGTNLAAGGYNVLIGYGVNVPTPANSNQLNIGNVIYATALASGNTPSATGNVGIGTTSPSVKLHVKTTSGSEISRFENAGTAPQGGYVTFYDTDGAITRGYVGYGATLFTGMANTDFGIRSASGIPFSVAGSVKVYIKSDGRVGIGTVTPDASLHAVSTGSVSAAKFVVASHAAYLGEFYNTTYSTTVPSLAFFGWNNGDANIGSFGGKLFLGAGGTRGTGSTVRVTIDNTNGNVGIAIATPTARLHLPAGTATAGTAALKFDTGGVLNTTAEAGAFEAAGAYLYYTASLGSRRTLAYADQIPTSLVTGSGQLNRIPYWSDASILDSSLMYYDATLSTMGISTVAPTARFQVGRFNSAPGTVKLSQSTQDISGTDTHFLTEFKVGDAIYIRDTTETYIIESINDDTTMTSTAVIASAANDSSYEYVSNLELFSIFGNGNIGFGTFAPQGRFDVVGAYGSQFLLLKDYCMLGLGSSSTDWEGLQIQFDGGSPLVSIGSGGMTGNGHQLIFNDTDGYLTGTGDLKVGFGGITVPTATLHLYAQTAAAGSAPLKFGTYATLMTAPEAGAFEADNLNLYYTIPNGSTPVRKTIAFTSDIGASEWTLASGNLYPTTTTNTLSIGTATAGGKVNIYTTGKDHIQLSGETTSASIRTDGSLLKLGAVGDNVHTIQLDMTDGDVGIGGNFACSDYVQVVHSTSTAYLNLWSLVNGATVQSKTKLSFIGKKDTTNSLEFARILTYSGSNTDSGELRFQTLQSDSGSSVYNTTTLNQRGYLGVNITPTSVIHSGGSIAGAVRTDNTASATLNANDFLLYMTYTGGNSSVTLPTAADCIGRIYYVKSYVGGANTCTVYRSGTDVIHTSTADTNVPLTNGKTGIFISAASGIWVLVGVTQK